MKIKLRNRLEVLMKDSGVNTFEEMAERLTTKQGWKISRSALSRKFRDENATFSISMIEAICNELQCLPGDLWETNVTEASDEEISEIQSRLQPFRYGMIHKSSSSQTSSELEKISNEDEQKQNNVQDDLSNVLGPSVSHLHAGKLTGKD